MINSSTTPSSLRGVATPLLADRRCLEGSIPSPWWQIIDIRGFSIPRYPCQTYGPEPIVQGIGVADFFSSPYPNHMVSWGGRDEFQRLSLCPLHDGPSEEAWWGRQGVIFWSALYTFCSSVARARRALTNQQNSVREPKARSRWHSTGSFKRA